MLTWTLVLVNGLELKTFRFEGLIFGCGKGMFCM